MVVEEVDGLKQRRIQEKLMIKMNKVNDDKHQSINGEANERTMYIAQIHERMQELKQDIVEQVDENLKDMVSKIVEGIQNIGEIKDWNYRNEKCYNDKKKFIEGDTKLSEKYFQSRNSMLTDLCSEINHLRTVYNMCVAILLILFINTAINDYFTTGSLQLGFTTMKLGFSEISYTLSVWLKMMTFTFGFYAAYTVWAQKRMKMLPKSNKIKLWDYSCLTIFISYQIAFLIIPPRMIMEIYLPPPSICIILFEQIRIVMKIHAFVRSTVPSIISYKPHTDNNNQSPPVPGFSKFLYFMFAPTIVYRDNYPRTKEIRWHLVAWYFFEFFMTVFCMTIMFERCVIPIYKHYGIEPFNLREFLLRYFRTVLPGFTIFLCGFYCLLHTWMNAFAEMLRFGDRLFYKDWWNSMSYDRYYRTWNVVVHDWLYVYIYKDMYELIAPRNKFLAKFAVFFTSALFHEYIIGFSLRLFCPIMFLTFGGVGFILIFINRNNNSTLGNIFMWYSLITGSGFLVCLYSMEYFAMINCPTHYNNLYDYFVPRFVQCYISINK